MSPSIQSKTLVILQTYSACASPILQLPFAASLPVITQSPWIPGYLESVSTPFAHRYTTHKPPLRPAHTNASLLRLFSHNHFDHPLTYPASLLLSRPPSPLTRSSAFSLEPLHHTLPRKSSSNQNGVQGGGGENLIFRD